mmetsp:Transcript_136642/g.437151  ORF Transcript_136642/g.437151 Transcript_136642/m.437151 type:complete len:222 (-) Transcript_136642:1147-1812(-)
MQLRQLRGTRRELSFNIQSGTPEQLVLPSGHVRNDDTLRGVLVAQHSRCRSDCLRGKDASEAGGDRDFNQVVGQAEALLRPSSPAQIPPQEGVGCRPVQPEAQDLPDPLSGVQHLIRRASAICDQRQPRRHLLAIEGVTSTQPSRYEGACHAGELQLGSVCDSSTQDIRVHVGQCSEHHILWVGCSLECGRRPHADVHLRDPIEQNPVHPIGQGPFRQLRG